MTNAQYKRARQAKAAMQDIFLSAPIFHTPLGTMLDKRDAIIEHVAGKVPRYIIGELYATFEAMNVLFHRYHITHAYMVNGEWIIEGTPEYESMIGEGIFTNCEIAHVYRDNGRVFFQ
jgi:hypothetical protein